MAVTRLDIQDAKDRHMFYVGQGHLLAFPTDSSTSNSSTGVPTNGVAGFAPGCLFMNFKGSAGSCLYVNTGTVTSTTWLNIA